MSPNAFLSLLARLLLSLIFIQGGLGKLAAQVATTAHIAELGLPVPHLAYYVSVLIEFGGGAAILLGVLTRPVAVVMAGFCLVTAAVAHYHPGDRGQMVNFWKNVAMAGGFLQLAASGAGAWSLDSLLRRGPREVHAAS